MITANDVTAYGTLFGVFLAAALNEYRARKVRNTLLDSNDAQHAKLDVIHALVNSEMGDKLRRVMEMAQRIADASRDPRDILVAAQAKADYLTHMARQTSADQVDMRGAAWPPPAPPPQISDPTLNSTETKTKTDK